MTGSDANSLEEQPEPRWHLLGAPLDSAGFGRGEVRAPDALRGADLASRIGAADLGDIDARIDDPRRDEPSGIVGLERLAAASEELGARVAELMDGGPRPLVLGGDCSLLIGALSGVRLRHERVGLWFVDGHLDSYDGSSSPWGEAADMALALVTGRGPRDLTAFAGESPLVDAADVVAVGYREGDDADAAEELELVDDRVDLTGSRAVAAADAGTMGSALADRLAERVAAAWLHLDLDILDQDALPAVTYPQPGGLDWETAAALLSPIARSAALIGVSVADFNPDLAGNPYLAGKVTDLLADVLGER